MSHRFLNVLTALAIFALASATLIAPSPAYAAEAVLDQFCENAEITAADSYWVINYHTGVGQTFKPTKDHLTSFSLALAGGTDVNTAITAKLTQEGGGLVLTKTAATSSASVSWVDFSFPTVTLDTTKTYRIELTTPSNTARWIVSTTPCYANGKAYVDGLGKDAQDFGFFTMGFTPPVDTPLLISKPTNLFGEYFSHDATNRISWKKSPTAGVEGYKIYRSKSASSGFALVSTTNAATLEYIDFSDIKPGKYYYYVIAFIGTTVSPSSGTISVTVPTPTTPTPTSTATTTPTVTLTITASPTVTEQQTSPTPSVTRTVLSIVMKDYFPQALSIFALLLCGIIALVVLMKRPKTLVTADAVAPDMVEANEELTPTEAEVPAKEKKQTPVK